MAIFEEIFRFYTRDDVYPEIIDYLRNRWVAIEATSNGKRVFIRHEYPGGPPLKISSKDDMVKTFLRYRKLRPRTIYGSINVYKKLNRNRDVEDLNNIEFSTPVIDIDLSLDEWRLGIEILDILLSFLEKHGIVKSLYIKWSGRGFHLHIHEKSISKDFRLRHNPLDISFSIVEYILRKNADDIKRVIEKSRDVERPLKVENKIDIQRVFTAPLSYHRSLDYIAVCFKPNQLYDFDISWAKPETFKHNREWREYIEGEADELSEKAIQELGGYRVKTFLGVKASKITSERLSEKPITLKGRIGRFQVMALLQAARYYLLKGDIEKAKSFGLNRAIFYAWAKYHRPRYGRSRFGKARRQLGVTSRDIPHESIGDELAFKSVDGWFMIGDQIQRPEDYDKQVKSKIENIIPYDIAWKAALNYVKKFPRKTLEKQNEFFKEVYEPIRDKFLDIIEKYYRDREKE